MAVSSDYKGSVFSLAGSAAINPTIGTVTRTVLVGEVIVIGAATSSGRGITSVADSKGNTWTIPRTPDHNGTTVTSTFAVCKVTTQLVSGDTITMQHGGTVSHGIQAHGFANVDLPTQLAGGIIAAGSADPVYPDFNPTGGGIQIGLSASGGAQASGVISKGFNASLGYVQSSAGTIRGSFMDYLPVTVTTNANHAPDGSTARLWAYTFMLLPDAGVTPPPSNTGAMFAVF